MQVKETKLPQAVALLALCAGLNAQEIPNLSGVWSDPPARAEDAFCHVGCPVESRDYLTALLDDPVHFDQTYVELRAMAQRYQATELIPSYLTPEALENYPYDRTLDPSLIHCEPWGFTREILSPHAMELTQYDDRVTLYYSEWTALRTVWLDGREPPADYENTLLGFSTGYYDGETLVVETEGITANHSNAGFAHTDQLTSTELFWKSEDGMRLDVEVTFEDPATLTRPLTMARAWAWAPGEEIFPYANCVIPE